MVKKIDFSRGDNKTPSLIASIFLFLSKNVNNVKNNNLSFRLSCKYKALSIYRAMMLLSKNERLQFYGEYE